MRRRSALGWLALAATALALGYWAYGAHQTRLLRTAVLELVREATDRANAVLAPRALDTVSLDSLEAQFKDASAALQRLAGLQTHRDPALSAGAQRYLDEVQALLRREIAVHRGQLAVQSAIAGTTEHLRAAGSRSSAWIQEAIARKRELERAHFDYRLAAGGLQKSLQSLRDARSELAPLAPGAPLVDEGRVAEARSRLDDESAQLQRAVAAAGTLPAPR